MNTTIVDGVEIYQGDEVEASDFIEGVWTRCEFLADIGPEYKCRYITTFTELNRKQFITNRYIRPIPKKQRVHLTQGEIMSDNKERELMVSKIGNDLAQIYTLNDLTKAQLQSIAGYIDRGYTDNSVYKSMRLKTCNEDEIRSDERRKVAEEIKSIIFIDGTGISGNNSYNRLANVANYCNAQLIEKKVDG